MRVAACLTVLLACIGVACHDAIAPAIPANAERFEPPAIYARWWAMTESCAGRARDFAPVRWYRVPDAAFGIEHGGIAGGAFYPSGNQIVLAAPYVGDGDAVRHEMLHAITRAPGHPHEHFIERCAAIVSCLACQDWRPPSRDYVTLPADSLAIDSEATLLPRETDGERWLALRVTARNTRETLVMIATPGSAPAPSTFGYRVFGPVNGREGSVAAADSSTLYFRPGETKRWLFEFRVDDRLSGTTVPVGVHVLSGGYAGRWAAFDTVEIRR